MKFKYQYELDNYVLKNFNDDKDYNYIVFNEADDSWITDIYFSDRYLGEDDCINMNSFLESASVAQTCFFYKNKFMILVGDFREEYEEAYNKGGWEECFNFYMSKRDYYRSDWSTD